MMRSYSLSVATAALLLLGAATSALGTVKAGKGPLVNLPLPGVGTAFRAAPLENRPSLPPTRPCDGVDILGDTMTVGSTWYEIQHNGTIGRMIVRDDAGKLHFVWTNGLDQASANRHVYYNYLDSTGVQGWPGVGMQVDASDRAGFTCLTVSPASVVFPAFHQKLATSINAHSAVAALNYGVFEIPWFGGEDVPFIWPRICRMQDGQMLVISTEAMASEAIPMPQTWCIAEFNGNEITYTNQELLEYSMTVAADVAASRVSNRVAAAWTTSRDPGFPAGSPSQYNNDIHMMIDDDGLNLNFENWFNLTQFIYPDTSFWPDTLLMDGDTLRAYTDISLFFDQNDYCHAAFTTLGFYQLDSLMTLSASLIWHWSEQFPNEFRLIANHWYNAPQPGSWNRNCQRPSLGQDSATGDLYCMYQVYDSSTVSAVGYPSGEVYVSVSTDGGWNWSVGTNVTNTVSPNGAAGGQCLSELNPSMAELVDDTCHIVYVLDLDAGNSQYHIPEGVPTLNPVKYHKVPINLIAQTPLMPQWPEPGGVRFHVEHIEDTTRVALNPAMPPFAFGLEQNAPNPFNPTTTIRFSLGSVSEIRLEVFNLHGERISTLARGVFSAGMHSVTFDGRGLATGVYIYRLTGQNHSASGKMVLMK